MVEGGRVVEGRKGRAGGTYVVGTSTVQYCTVLYEKKVKNGPLRIRQNARVGVCLK